MVDEELKEIVKEMRILRKELKKDFPKCMGADEFLKMSSGKMAKKEMAYWELHMRACPCCKATFQDSIEDSGRLEEIIKPKKSNLLKNLGIEPKEFKEIMASF